MTRGKPLFETLLEHIKSETGGEWAVMVKKGCEQTSLFDAMRWNLRLKEEERIARQRAAEIYGLYPIIREMIDDAAAEITGIDSAGTTKREVVDKALFRAPIADFLDVIGGTLRISADGRERVIEHLRIERTSPPAACNRGKWRRKNFRSEDLIIIKKILDGMEDGTITSSWWGACEDAAKDAPGTKSEASKTTRLSDRAKQPKFRELLEATYPGYTKLLDKHALGPADPQSVGEKIIY
jgi:hypothetical protein